MKIPTCSFSHLVYTLLFLTSSLACAPLPSQGKEKDEEWGGQKKQFEKSFSLWQKLKDKHQGNYSYTKKWSSWTGSSQTTTIIVSNNRVTERKFESIGAPHPDGRPVDKNRWAERGDFIGSASDTQAHPAKTLDLLYAEAKELLAKPIPPFHKGVLRLNEQGLLLCCYTQDTRIADDAPVSGVHITSITLGNQKPLPPPETPLSFEQWVANGKKLPEGMMFIGGSPWFNESTGQKRTAQEVYQMVYGKTPFADCRGIPQKVVAITSVNHEIHFPSGVDESAIDAMKLCLHRNPKERPPIIGNNGLLNEHCFLRGSTKR